MLRCTGRTDKRYQDSCVFTFNFVEDEVGFEIDIEQVGRGIFSSSYEEAYKEARVSLDKHIEKRVRKIMMDKGK